MIVACTGHVEEEYIQKAWQHGMNEVIGKPVGLDIIKQLISEMIIIT